MKKFNKIITIVMAAALAFVSVPFTAKADSSKVVTLGANLTEEQRKSMYDYFGTSADKVETIEVTNTDERKYMEGIATEAQIGTRTYSCSYVEPTSSGGIQVKVANLTFVTSSMIASTLLTSGVENCNVVAGSPIEVSGTGALTGIMMAYETASGEELSEDQKATATEELVTTGELAESIGQQEAADLMNEVKQEVIEDGLTDEGEIQDTVDNASKDLDVSLSDEQKAKIVSLMQSISQYDYNADALKKTLDNLNGGESQGFFSKIWSSIKSFFTGGDSDGGIINNTDDSILGDSAIIDSTIDGLKSKTADDGESFWDKIVNFFKGLFGGNDAEDADAEETTDDADTPDDADVQDSGSGADSDVDSGTDSDVPADENGTDGGTDTSTDGGTDVQGGQDSAGQDGDVEQ